ncbi:MAG TPA: YetF domain-containing protein [Chloroflexota bacterium]|nr:YetF domain-containing protein [Chloroflexota bacterium]
MLLAYLWSLSMVVGRTAVVLAVVVLEVRLIGRRVVGGMNLYDVATVLAVANAVQNAMTRGSGNLGAGLTSAGTLLAIGALLGGLFWRWPTLEAHVVGTPTIVVKNGRLIRRNLAREGLTEAEVLTAIHEFGLSGLADVELAILEADGSLSVVPKREPADRTFDR